MAWTKYQSFIVALLIGTGSINALTAKWLNLLESVGSDGKDPRRFKHPFLQACFMFLGELLCLIAFQVLLLHYRRKRDGSEDNMKLLKGSRTFNPLVLLVPSICDLIAASGMYIALILTHAASFLMLRGAVIVFVGLFSMCFLDRKLGLQEWGGIFLVILGLALVGLSDFLSPVSSEVEEHFSTRDIIIGDILIVATQLITAIQLVWEEKYVMKHDIPPLQAAGLEGAFGFTIIVILLFPFYFIPVPEAFSGNPRNVLEDAIDGLVQIFNNQIMAYAAVGHMVCIAFFNYAGISVTKELSATSRKVLDSVRTLFVWIVTLSLGWQAFYWLQIIGFIALVIGTLVYNRALIGLIVRLYNFCCCKKQHQERTADQQDLPKAAEEDTEDTTTTQQSPANVPENKQT